jgi:hypothetical protein
MDPSEVLMLIVEASLGLAGFAGVVTAVGQRSVAGLVELQRLNLVNLLAIAFGALFMSLGALALQSAKVDDATIWRIWSGVGIVPWSSSGRGACSPSVARSAWPRRCEARRS